MKIMRKALSACVSFMLVTGMVVIGLTATAPSASAAVTSTQPQKVALIVFENQTYNNIAGTACNAGTSTFGVIPDPYICTNLVGGGISGTINLTGMAQVSSGSAAQYAYITSADNCGGTVNDAYWNTLSNSALPTGTAPVSGAGKCGVDVFTQYDAATGVSWHSYAEGFSADSGNANANETLCLDGESDGGTTNHNTSSAIHQSYVRRHTPSTFYAGSNTAGPPIDCQNGGVGGPPNNDTGFNANSATDDTTGGDERAISNAGNNSGHPFGTLTGGTFPDTFSYIVPDLCHDMHNSGAHQSASSGRADCSFDDTVITGSSITGTTVTLKYTHHSTGTDFNIGQTLVVKNVGWSMDTTAYSGKFTVTSATSTAVKYVVPSNLGAVVLGTSPSAGTDAWGNDTSGNHIPDGYSASCTDTQNADNTGCAQIYAGDQWLAYNLNNIRSAVGAHGEVVVTWDESGTVSTTAIPTFIVPGMGATLAGCGAGGTCTDSTAHNAYSTAQALVNIGAANQTGGTTISTSQFDTAGQTNVGTNTALPTQLGPTILQTTNTNSGNTTSPTISFSPATTTGSTLVMVFTNPGTGTPTCPSGPVGGVSTMYSTAKTVGSASTICYLVNADSVSSVTASVGSSAKTWAAIGYEISPVAFDTGVSATNSSSVNGTTTPSTGTVTPSLGNGEVVLGNCFANGTTTVTPDANFTSFTQASGTGNTTTFGSAVRPNTSAIGMSLAWGTSRNARCTIATFG